MKIPSLLKGTYYISSCKCVHVNILQYSVSKSGTEEDYTKLMQLLEDIQQYLQDFALAKAEEMKSATQKRKEDKRKDEEMCKAAMEGMSSKKAMSSHAINQKIMLLLLYIFIERSSSPSTVDLNDDDEVSGSNSKQAKTNKGIYVFVVRLSIANITT